jgi:hypothetical protein
VMARQQAVVSTGRYVVAVCRMHAWCYGDMLVDHVAVPALFCCPLSLKRGRKCFSLDIPVNTAEFKDTVNVRPVRQTDSLQIQCMGNAMRAESRLESYGPGHYDADTSKMFHKC